MSTSANSQKAKDRIMDFGKGLIFKLFMSWWAYDNSKRTSLQDSMTSQGKDWLFMRWQFYFEYLQGLSLKSCAEMQNAWKLYVCSTW